MKTITFRFISISSESTEEKINIGLVVEENKSLRFILPFDLNEIHSFFPYFDIKESSEILSKLETFFPHNHSNFSLNKNIHISATRLYSAKLVSDEILIEEYLHLKNVLGLSSNV